MKSKNNNNTFGFTLIEVMISLAIMSTISLAMLQMFDNQTKNLKQIEFKFEMNESYQQITQILKDPLSCKNSFKEFKLSQIQEQTYKNEDFLKFEIKKFILIKRKINGKLVSHDYLLSKLKNIAKIELLIDYENIGQIKDFLTLPSTLKITYKKPKYLYHLYTKKIQITHYFAFENKKIKYTHCNSRNISSNKVNFILVSHISHPNLNGQSGLKACQMLGMKCGWVQSTNFLFESRGNKEIGFVCQSSYNQSLPGVQDGSPMPNVHSCEAKIGNYQTYKIDRSNFNVECRGLFHAACF